MPTITLFPIEDAYVLGNVPALADRNFGKESRLWIESDSCSSRFSAKGYTHETAWTYLKFKLPDSVKPEWIKSVTLHLFIPDARFVGSTVQVTDLTIRILATTPDWREDTITWNNKPDGTFIQRVILKSCQETGICGQTGRCQVGGSFNLGHVNIPLLFWKVVNRHISLILQAGSENNAMWTYSREASVSNDLKPYLKVSYEETAVTEYEGEAPKELEFTEPLPEEKVDILFVLQRGLREIIVRIGEEEKELKFIGDSFVYTLTEGTRFEVTALPKIGIVGYRANLMVSRGKEVIFGFPWKIRVKNVEFTPEQ